MKGYFSLLIIGFCLLLQTDRVQAFQAQIWPEEIYPGEAFIVRVTDAGHSSPLYAKVSKRKLQFSTCGKSCYIAVGAIDLQTKPGIQKISLRAGMATRELTLKIMQPHYPVQELTLPKEKVFLSSENLKRVRKEQQMVQTLFQGVSEKIWEGRFILPLTNSISTEFGTRRLLNKELKSVHRGVDIRGKEGENVRAANTGKVVLVENLFYGGNTVILDHGQGIYSIYMHLSGFNVALNEDVSKGNIVGFVGSTGRATGPHLHFGIKVLTVSVNPISFTKLAFDKEGN